MRWNLAFMGEFLVLFAGRGVLAGRLWGWGLLELVARAALIVCLSVCLSACLPACGGGLWLGFWPRGACWSVLLSCWPFLDLLLVY